MRGPTGSRLALLFAVAVAGLPVSLLAYMGLLSAEHRSTKTNFSFDAARLAGAIQRDLARDVEVMEAIKAFWGDSDTVERDEFHVFSEPLLRRHPGIRVLAWAPLVPDQQRAAYQRDVRTGRSADYRISEIGVAYQEHHIPPETDPCWRCPKIGRRVTCRTLGRSAVAKASQSMTGLSWSDPQETRVNTDGVQRQTNSSKLLS